MHRCLSSLLALTLPLIATEALIAQGRRIPTAEELDSARTDVVRVMAERMLRSVGVNLLLNWEVEPQNHLWINGACHRTTPPALTASEEHTILIFTDGAYAHVCIDDKHMWTVNSHLAGTVSVYPALGSEIFVREILIDGTPAGMVDAPLGVMM
jgi:hypothetical protein